MGLSAIITKINWVDLLILVLFIKITYTGLKRGFSGEIMPLLIIFATFMIALHNYSYIGYLVNVFTPISESISKLLSFLILACILIIFFAILKKFMLKFGAPEALSFVDKIGGFVLGAFRATLTVSFILVILVLAPLRYLDISVKDNSFLGYKFLKTGPVVYDKLSGIFPGASQHEKGFMARRFMRN